MRYGVCLLSQVPGREKASDASEMVTQLLFGDTYEVIEEEEKFLKVKLAHDGYECWICIKQHTSISDAEFDRLQKTELVRSYELISLMQNAVGLYFPVVIGSRFPKPVNGQFQIAGNTFVYDGQVTEVKNSADKQQIVNDAYLYLNAPYLWGGKSPMGIDCSGFTQVVYGLSGVEIPRDASQQIEVGEPYSFVEEAEPGDLAFFDNAEGKITHVGIVLKGGKIIHASGQVRIDKLDHYGIFNAEKQGYTHKLRLIKNLIV
jgi:hypothetical protein